MKIRYLGWLDTDNLGDLALYSAIQALFEPDHVTADATDCDAVMIGGGTLIFRNPCAEEAQVAARGTDPVFVFGTGVGDPEFNEITKLEPWQNVLGRAFYVGVRGFRSSAILRDHGFRGPVEVTGDPALILRSRMPNPVPDDRRIVINLCYARRSRLWGFDNRAVRSAVLEAGTALLQAGRSLTFVSFESRDDWFVQEAVAALEKFGDVEFVKGYESLDRTLDLLAGARLLIGEKLHSIIFAAAVGTPFVSLAYRPKCLDFCESIDWEGMMLRTDQLTAARILERVQYLDTCHRELRDRLQESVGIYREKLRGAASRIREHLQQTASV